MHVTEWSVCILGARDGEFVVSSPVCLTAMISKRRHLHFVKHVKKAHVVYFWRASVVSTINLH